LLGDEAGVVLRDKAKAVDGSLTIQFRAADDELIDVRQHIRRVAEAKPRHLRITKQDPRQQSERRAAA
jgi:hypothetical protein